MGFEIVDRYLLGEPVSKPDAVAALLRERSPLAAAAPFYRALDAIGARADDMALVALRLILAGRAPDDEPVRRMRALSGVARACANGDRAGLKKIVARDAGVLGDLPLGDADLGRLRSAVRAAYERELAGS